MQYHIYCSQKNIRSNYQAAYAEYQKRLSAYCNTSLHIGGNLADSMEVKRSQHHFILIKPGASTYSSEEFSEYLNRLQLSCSTVHITIGFPEAEFYEAIGTVPEPDTVDRIALTKSSLSPEILTLLFYEQLYRGYTISQGKTYHK